MNCIHNWSASCAVQYFLPSNVSAPGKMCSAANIDMNDFFFFTSRITVIDLSVWPGNRGYEFSWHTTTLRPEQAAACSNDRHSQKSLQCDGVMVPADLMTTDNRKLMRWSIWSNTASGSQKNSIFQPLHPNHLPSVSMSRDPCHVQISQMNNCTKKNELNKHHNCTMYTKSPCRWHYFPRHRHHSVFLPACF